MSFWEILKSVFEYTEKKRREKKEDREFHYLQHSGVSILQKSNFADHSYMQKSSIGIEKSRSFLDGINRKK